MSSPTSSVVVVEHDSSLAPITLKPTPTPLGPLFHELLATIPYQPTDILSWAYAAGAILQIPREQISYYLGFYHHQLTAMGVRMAQNRHYRYRDLFVPTLGTDSGSFYSHIWREL